MYVLSATVEGDPPLKRSGDELVSAGTRMHRPP